MLLGMAFLLLLLASAQFVRGTLSEFSWGRLEKHCLGRPELMSRIFQRHEEVAASFRVVFWIIFGTVGLLIAYSSAAGTVGDHRFLLLWVTFLAFQFFFARPLASAFAEGFLSSTWPTLESIAWLVSPIIKTERAIEKLL